MSSSSDGMTHSLPEAKKAASIAQGRDAQGTYTPLVAVIPLHPMSIMASMPSAMPTSKKRCWTLLVKDVKNMNVKEAEVLSSFRKRYTSARNLAFRSPTNYDDDIFLATSDNANDNSTFPSSTEEGTVLIEVQFTGPQPIEGPADMLCTLLQGTFVAAYPIQLGRGRKRKVRAGIAAGEIRTTASSSTASTSSCNESERSFASSSNFEFQRNHNVSSSSTNACPARRASRPKTAGHNDTGTSDTASEASTTCVFSSTSSATSSISTLDEGFKDLLDGGSTAHAATSSTVSRTRLLQNVPTGRPPSADGATTAAAAAAAGRSPHLSDPGLAAGNCGYVRREKPMLQRGAGSFFAGGANTTTAAAAAATASEEHLWDLLLDDQDSLPCPPAPSCQVSHPSSSWGLHPVHAPGALEGNDYDGDDAHGRTTREPHAFSAMAPALVQQEQQWWRRPWRGGSDDEERCNLQTAAGHHVSFGWREQECGFDGRSTMTPPRGAGAPSPASSPHGTSPVGSRCHFTFQGLQSAVQVHEIGDLAVRARFFIDAEQANAVDKIASPLEVDAYGRAHTTVTYPSIFHISPELYSMESIRVIEVGMVVEVRSRDGKFVYTGPTLKVIYRRPARRVFATSIPMARQNPHVSCGP